MLSAKAVVGFLRDTNNLDNPTTLTTLTTSTTRQLDNLDNPTTRKSKNLEHRTLNYEHRTPTT